MADRKHLRKLAGRARKAGWEVKQLPSGHTHWYGPNGEHVVSSSSPKNPGHAVRRIERDLRKRGFIG